MRKLIAAAVAAPPVGATIRSRSPWITRVGAVIAGKLEAVTGLRNREAFGGAE